MSAARKEDSTHFLEEQRWHTLCSMQGMSRILAAFVVIALAVSAIPSAAIAPVCHRCCEQPRLDAGHAQMPPCCRISTDAPRPVARQADGPSTSIVAGFMALPAVFASADLLDHARRAAMAPRLHKPPATLRI